MSSTNANSKYVRIIGTTVAGLKPESLFKREVLSASIDGIKKKAIDMRDAGFNRPVDISWLARASEVYQISPNIKDYVVVPVGIITANIPNRNSQCFNLKALTDFSPEHGCLRYKTFIGKPTHINHQADIIENAKGVNLDASIIFVENYGVAKIMILSAFCRQKDPALANAILKGKRKSYSMGAIATTFECSICGGVLGPAIVRTCKCYGTDYTQLNTLGSIKHGKIHYHSAVDPQFVENSSVDDPADFTAVAEVL